MKKKKRSYVRKRIRKIIQFYTWTQIKIKKNIAFIATLWYL